MQESLKLNITKELWGQYRGKDCYLIHLKNKKNTTLVVSNYGALVYALKIQAADSLFKDVVVGLNTLEDYIQDHTAYYGATVGRFAGRISKGSLLLNDKSYHLHKEKGVHLHGGAQGFNKKVWHIDAISHGENPSVTMSCISPDLEEGYPGTLCISVRYTLTEKDALQIEYFAVTDKTTVVNLTNHSYFNLHGTGSLHEHQLQIQASTYLDTTDNLLPTGKTNTVANSPFDYQKQKNIDNKFTLLDTTYITEKALEKPKATLYSERSKIQMQVYSNQPALVVYTPQTLQATGHKKNYTPCVLPAICFEAQNYPDAPNQPGFPSAVLHPNQKYYNSITYAFSIKD